MRIPFHDKELYVEVHGEGKALVMLNGIMMSTASWKAFMDAFTEHNQLVLIDMLDQGQSSKMEGQEYTQELQVEAVKTVIETLGLKEVALFGISYGGEVAIQLAIKYPNLVERCLFFNTTAHTPEWLKEIGHAWNKAASDPEAYYATTIPVIYSPTFYEKHIDWMNARKEFLYGVFSNEVFMRAMVRLTNSSEHLDVRDECHKITCPCLIVSCEEDTITPVSFQRDLASRIEHSEYVLVPGSGHALMYEKPQLFASLVMGFVNTARIGKII